MEANKIKGEAKSVVLSNGVELTYCEYGQEHEEIVISGAFYFHTFAPVLEGLAKRYHVYGVVMRGTGETVERMADGTVNWDRQWGRDIYDFARAMGIERFHYVGKCHGTNPGWYLVKEHPEVLYDFCSFYMAPHVLPRNSNQWMDTVENEGPQALMAKAMRHQERIPLKIAEIQALGPEGAKSLPPETQTQADSPEVIWDSLEDCRHTLENCPVPVLYLFGTDDIVFQDHLDATLLAMRITKGAKTVMLQGERHLLEMDCPQRMVDEAFFFIDELAKKLD